MGDNMTADQANERDTFIGEKTKTRQPPSGCMYSSCTRICCIVTGVFGGLFVLLGLLAVFLGASFLQSKILASMALTPGSDRFESWLHPPVQPYLTGYAFHLTNPQAVLAGKKPMLEERGPYVYKSVTVKDADGNNVWHDDDGTLTYRARKFYTYVPELSGEGLDPTKDMLTVPNIPLWTGLNSLKKETGAKKDFARDLITGMGRGTPFVEVTFDGLLWGYEDELPCAKLDMPASCDQGDSPFGSSDFGDDDDFDFKRKKRSVDDSDDKWANIENDPESEYFGVAKPKAEFVDCKCNWGLFRDRNVTMRKPLRFYTGQADLDKKGVVTHYDGKQTLGWWKEGSQCNAVKGQDASTLPPMLTKEHSPEIFISLMCRTLMMEYEKDVEHADINTLRFVARENAMGAHDDPVEARKNSDNECYCLPDEGFRCFKSGVLNMEPCKRNVKAPLALSMPHFYQADPYFREAVGGMKPDKEKHQFYMDVVPEFGFPLAIRPRFQLNLVVGRSIDSGWDAIADMQEEIVLPFLWAQDGFSEPSDVMAEQIRFGLEAPNKLPMMIALFFFVVGAVLLLVCLSYFIWRRRQAPVEGPKEVIRA